jgi:hypothetical protein
MYSVHCFWFANVVEQVAYNVVDAVFEGAKEDLGGPVFVKGEGHEVFQVS